MDKFILVSILLVVFSVDCFDVKCHVCTGGGGDEDLCAAGEEGEVKQCPEKMRLCKHTWTQFPGMDRKYYRGCVEKFSEGKEKLTRINVPFPSTRCRIAILENGGVKQECFCQHRNQPCNKEFDDLPRLKCHFCKDSNNESSVSPCPHGAETEVKECTIRYKPACTTIISKESGERVSVGCKERYFLSHNPQCDQIAPNHPFNPEVVDVYYCQCYTDSCNIYTERVNDLIKCRYCHIHGDGVCGKGRYGNEVESGDETICLPGTKFCYTAFTSPVGGGIRDSEYYKTCAKELPAKDDKFGEYTTVDDPAPASCRFKVENNVIKQECFCSSNSCNSDFEDITDRFLNKCFECPKSGEGNLCATGYEGKGIVCPDDEEYCYHTWIDEPGKERKYYKGCSKEPAEKDKFNRVSSPITALCRNELLDNGGIKQQCFCSENVCNWGRWNFHDLSSRSCFVCTQVGRDDNLCAPGDEGVERLCPTDLIFCQNTWTSNPGEERKYYKKCVKNLPAENDFTVTEEGSVSCRIDVREKVVTKQECYCSSNNCNSKNFPDLPIPTHTTQALKCFVCIRGRGESNLCAPGEKGEVTPCRTGMTYCKSTFNDHPGLGKVYYKGCAEEPADKNKFTDSAPCHSEQGKGVAGQECYCKSNLCNVHFDHLLNSNINNGNNVVPSSVGDVGEGIQEYENGCFSPNKRVNTFVCVIIAPAIYYFI